MKKMFLLLTIALISSHAYAQCVAGGVKCQREQSGEESS